MIPRPFFDTGVTIKEENCQQNSKGMIELMECKTQSHSKSQGDDANPGWISNEVTRLGSFRDVDQASETMSMIKKARVSVRARSENSMVSM